MKEFDEDHAFDVYQRVWFCINSEVTSVLDNEIEEVRDYVIRRLNDEFRFTFIYD